jgi:hypothetical protein
MPPDRGLTVHLRRREHRSMTARRIVGAILVLLGGVWFFQGIGVIGGSFMTNNSTWVLIGAIVVIVGVALIVSPRRPS